jgi:hypothetical protein
MKPQHKKLDPIRQGMTPQVNLLRRALIEARGAKGLNRTGRSLAGGRHLINTYRSAQANVVNDDRFKRSFIEPSIEASMSLTIDISGSMDQHIGRTGMSIGQHVTLAACGLVEVLDKLGVGHEMAFCDMESVNGAGGKGASARYRGLIYPFSKTKQGVLYPVEKLLRFPMNGGTNIATYADSAIKMVAKHNAQNKVAIYMTDGCCHSVAYLKSLEQIAKRQGITLVGVVMGSEYRVSDHPNGVFAQDGVELGKIILSHLAKAVSGKLK